MKGMFRSVDLKKKSVLFVINTLGTAGAERAFLELIKSMPVELEVSLYVLLNQGELVCELPSSVRLLNSNFDKTPIHGKEGKKHLKRFVLKSLFRNASILRNLFYIFKNTFRMLKKKDLKIDKLLWRTVAKAGMKPDEEYDLAVSYIEGGSAYYVSDYVKAKKKACFIHVDVVEAGYTRELDKGCYECFDKIFTVSNEVREAFISLYPEYKHKTEIFRNIINPKRIEEKAAEGSGFEDGFKGKRILSVGRLNKQKFFQLSIDAMALIKEKVDFPVRWYVLGEGDERQALEDKIKELKLTDAFFLCGNVSNPYPFIKQCDIFAHCTKFEGKSIAVAEAKILGKAIVLTDVPGNREQVDNMKSGVLVPLQAEAISKMLVRLLTDEKLSAFLGENARISMTEECSESDLFKLTELLR